MSDLNCDYGLVSIIMPSYNTCQYIGKAIESIINQTYLNWELIIVDDCSTDESLSVIYSFSDNRIRVLINDHNSGAAYSRNRAIKEAKGRWIAFLDSDDIWFPNKLERQIMYMVRNNIGFSYTKYCEIDSNGQLLDRIISGPKALTFYGMCLYCWPGCLTVMYNADDVGLIQINEIKQHNDYAMWLKISKIMNCYLLPEVLAGYRVSRFGSISSIGYLKTIRNLYVLHVSNNNRITACILTLLNIVFAVVKKVIYISSYGGLF